MFKTEPEKVLRVCNFFLFIYLVSVHLLRLLLLQAMLLRLCAAPQLHETCQDRCIYIPDTPKSAAQHVDVVMCCLKGLMADCFVG